MGEGLLAGRCALVTGAGRGIGSAIATLMAAEGAAVALAYRHSRGGAEEMAAVIGDAGGKAVVLQADAADAGEAAGLVAAAQEALGGLDILVNNAAGFGPLKFFSESSWTDIDEEWNAVVRPVFQVTRAALPLMIGQGNGRIVNLAASLVQRPAVRYGAHTMAKAAVLAFTRTLAREVGPHGITVNAVSPGVTMTDFSKTLPPAVLEQVTGQTPLRRLATAADVARAVLYFASPLADFVTGANLSPDGGLAIL
jgi:3-oxoacyl-[acyl-carrier protein] reductase